MAGTIFQGLWAVGRQTSAFLQSVFLSPLTTLLRHMGRLPGLSFLRTLQQNQTPGPSSGSSSLFSATSKPVPSSASTSTASPPQSSTSTPPPKETDQVNLDFDLNPQPDPTQNLISQDHEVHDSSTDIAATENKDTADSGNQNTQVPAAPDDHDNSVPPSGEAVTTSQSDDDGATGTMAPASTYASVLAQPARVKPVVPRESATPATLGPEGNKENRSTEESLPAGSDNALTDKLAGLSVNDATAENGQEGAAASSTGLQGSTNDNKPQITEFVELDNWQQEGIRTGNEASASTAATESPAADTITTQVQPKNESPVQKAERAMHSRFMREALDVVSSSLLPLLPRFVFPPPR
jgi:hypothetical protein